MNANFENLYHAAQAADAVFHAAVIKQFGSKDACTMRYVTSEHNSETRAAAAAYWTAANALTEATRKMRETSETVYVPIVGRTADGKQVVYTGRAGQLFISDELRDAFMGFSLEGARNKASVLNRMSALHGVHFMACVGTLAQEIEQAKAARLAAF